MSTPIHPREGDDRSVGNGFADAAAPRGIDAESSPEVAESGGAPPPVAAPDEQHPRSVVSDRSGVVARQRERFGGVKVGSAFFGWLTATGMAVLLVSLLAAAGVAFGAATDTSLDQATRDTQNDVATAQTVGLVGGIVLLVILLVSYYCGGYVAGRMARFNGLRQGVAVCLWGVIMALLLAAIAAIAGTRYGVFAGIDLPTLPIADGHGALTGAIAIGATVLTALIGAMLGGLAGMRFHRRVDKAGLETHLD